MDLKFSGELGDRGKWAKPVFSYHSSSFVCLLPFIFRMPRTVCGFLQGKGTGLGSLLIEVTEASQP